MKGNKNKINKKYTKIMLLTLLIIASILSMYLVTNTNNEVFNAKIINQKADTREVVNIPDQDLKNFLLTYFKKPDNERKNNYNSYFLKLSNTSYIKPSTENEVYKEEMEKILELSAENINTKQTAMDLTGLETTVNLTNLFLPNNKIDNVEPLKGLTNLTRLFLGNNKIENMEPLKELTNLEILNLNDNKIENIDALKGLTNLRSLSLITNKIENVESIRGLANLKYLILGYNKIENIEPLKGLTNLTYLYLEGNKIENIDALKGLTSLRILILSNNKIENMEPLRGLINLTNLSVFNNKIKNIEPLRGLINLINLSLFNNKIDNIDSLKGLTKLTNLGLYNEEINVSPNTNKFNLPVLKKYNGEILDIVQASNGLLKKNEDGTYSFIRKVTGVQRVNVGTGIYNKDPKVDENWNYSYTMYILKIDPTNIADEKVLITKTIKDKSNTLLNNDKETKVLPVIKRNGQIITNANTNNVGHRANNDELLTYTFNELPKTDDTYTDYNYEVTFDISGLPEGYSIVPNTKTADNQADFNITYVSPKVSVNKEVPVIGGNKELLPQSIKVIVKNDKGLPEKEVDATLKADKSGYVINENLDKTTNTGETITYTVVPKTEITNYVKSDNGYTYVTPRINITVEKNWVNGETVRPETITAKLKKKIASDNTYTFVQDVTVRKDNNWRLVVSNLEKTDANGNDYTYIVEEETNVDNFNPSYSGLTITNTYTVPNISKDFSVRVTGGKKDILPNEVEVTVKNNNGLAEKVVNATLNRDKTAYEVTGVNLAKTQNDGTVVTYKVVPKTDITNYEKDVVGENGYSYVIPKINFEKTINKNGGKEISLIVKLKKNGVLVTPEKSVIINSGETARFTDLDKTDFDGNENTYSVEVVPNGTLEDGYSINTKPNGDVEVLYTSPKTSATKDITVNRWR